MNSAVQEVLYYLDTFFKISTSYHITNLGEIQYVLLRFVQGIKLLKKKYKKLAKNTAPRKNLTFLFNNLEGNILAWVTNNDKIIRGKLLKSVLKYFQIVTPYEGR